MIPRTSSFVVLYVCKLVVSRIREKRELTVDTREGTAEEWLDTEARQVEPNSVADLIGSWFRLDCWLQISRWLITVWLETICRLFSIDSLCLVIWLLLICNQNMDLI